MFLDKKEKTEEQRQKEFIETPEQLTHDKSLADLFAGKEMIIIAIVLVIVLGLAGLVYVYIIQKKPNQPPAAVIQPNPTSPQDPVSGNGNLPSGFGNAENGGDGNGNSSKAEELAFAQFYKNEIDEFQPFAEKIDLPINIKSEVANYHDLSRKINLDPYIDELNKNGFIVIKNQFSDHADNFYSMYKFLSEKEIPILITNDFIFYYYQNIFKEMYKEIERDVFYDDIWQIARSFYEIANNKYITRYKEVGVINDPVLEALRLEAAYFAITLRLLSPKQNQITAEIKSDKMFTKEEAELISFDLPAYLEEDGNKEISLINQANQIIKSPILLYQKNYKEFNIPPEYQSSAKLSNYYLAAKWFNSAFPLYYIKEDCPDCLLDENDWLINMMTACMIAEDFAKNQEFKNRWAKIYKIVSFFSGLRNDLTYLHYHDALVSLFGDDYKIDIIFSQENSNRDEDLIKLQKKIAQYEFNEIEGGLDRDLAAHKPYLGMKILQEPYWPNDYIFNSLTYPIVNSYLGDQLAINNKNNSTYCIEDRTPSRCKGMAQDIINLVYPIPESNSYFKENTNYENYNYQVNQLKKQLNSFTMNTWYNYNYWTTINTIKNFLNSSNSRPIYADNNKWQEKNINTSLAAWVNLQLNSDKLATSYSKENIGLTLLNMTNDFDYIESDLALVNELLSNTNMVSQMLIALNIIRDYESTKLNRLYQELSDLKEIITKELKSQDLDYDDLAFINNFTKQYIVASEAIKSLNLDKVVSEDIKGVKLLIIIYKKEDKKVLTVGPVFNYQNK